MESSNQKQDAKSHNLRLFLIGLTGGVATGKSTVGKMLEALGACCLDTDLMAHEAIRRGRPAYDRVVEIFGADVLGEDGEVDRKKLGGVVFADAGRRRELERITHPEVARLLQEALQRVETQVVVVMVPLLYEAGMEGFFRQVWVVTCSEEKELERLMRRDGLSEEEARQRIAAQMPLAEKAARADVVIRNDGDLQETRRQVEAAWRRIPRGKK